MFDTQHTGEIDARELKAAMKAFGLDVKKEDIKNIMRGIKKDTKDTVNFAEFTNIMVPRLVGNILFVMLKLKA